MDVAGGRAGKARVATELPAPANGVVALPIAHTSLLVAVTFAPSMLPKPPMSVPPPLVLPAAIEFSSVRVSLLSPSTPAAPPGPELPETVELISVSWNPPFPVVATQPA